MVAAVSVPEFCPTLHFDRYQFEDRYKRCAFPVSATTRIDYSDITRMHVHTRKQSGCRRLSTPEWGTNDCKLRRLLVVLFERRAHLRPIEGTLRERLARAEAEIARQSADKRETLVRLCREHAASSDPKRRRVLLTQIKSLDTSIKFSSAATVAAVVCYYYRLRLDSPGVAMALGLHAPGVRQILWRLAKVWRLSEECAKAFPDGRHFSPPARSARWTPDARARQSALLRAHNPARRTKPT